MDNNNNNKLRFWIPRKSNRPNQRFSSLHTTDESVFFLFFFFHSPRRRCRRRCPSYTCVFSSPLSPTFADCVSRRRLDQSRCPCVLVLYQSFTSIYTTQHRILSLSSLSPSCPFLCVFFLLLSSFPPPQTPYTPLNPNNAKKAVQTTQLFLVVAVSLAYHTLQPPSNPQ